ncbi:MAG TPA: preQ(1) synthase [Oculatellaceae cyanobacterium]
MVKKTTTAEEQLELKHLGQKSPITYDSPNVSLLEWVPNAFREPSKNIHNITGMVHIEAPEFTSLCPVTGQPDFGMIVIDYEPRERCVESKSLKLYLGAFRQQGIFQEDIINKIANDLITLLDPEILRIEGRFTSRGGIFLTPRAEYRRTKR